VLSLVLETLATSSVRIDVLFLDHIHKPISHHL